MIRSSDLICACLLITVALAGCGSNNNEPQQTLRPGQTGTTLAVTQTDDWSERRELPILKAIYMQPILDKDNFESSMTGVEIRHKGRVSPTEEPFASDGEAVAAALAWIKAHFGALPDYSTLEAVSILHSSSGSPQSRLAWDKGHTITFIQKYHSLKTDGGAILYITGKKQFSGTINLYTCEKINGSEKPIVSKSDAISKVRKSMVDGGAVPEALRKFDEQVNARLRYAWSPAARKDWSKSGAVVAPTWALDEEERFMVDGHSGQVWIND